MTTELARIDHPVAIAVLGRSVGDLAGVEDAVAVAVEARVLAGIGNAVAVAVRQSREGILAGVGDAIAVAINLRAAESVPEAVAIAAAGEFATVDDAVAIAVLAGVRDAVQVGVDE